MSNDFLLFLEIMLDLKVVHCQSDLFFHQLTHNILCRIVSILCTNCSESWVQIKS